MPGEAHILVGCGGSGIKTLRRLNQLLSQDYYWRRRLDNDIYYVIVDTDADEMQDFENAVNRDLEGAIDKPFIVPIQLSKGETHLQPLVNEYFLDPFEEGQNLEGQQRLLEHWWNRGPEAPFVAPRVTAVTEGAGQCPPVSYFLTWKNLANLEREFQRLIEAIQRRKGGFGRWDVLNFIVVAGLSGGTGRGSWELIAFKMRELFARYGQPPTPRAFLLDSSIFRDVFQSNPEQRAALRVNCLTGMSELSCWIANKREGEENPKAVVEYRLPSMQNPTAADADVLQVDLKLDVNNAAPVNHAYLIFDNNGVAHLEDHIQYCEMAGAGIYAALSKSSILSQAINSNFPYVGLATSTFEVNAATLRQYFEGQAHVQAAKMLMQVDAEKVEAKVRDFFKRSGLLIDITDDDPVTFFRGDPKGTLVQKIVSLLDEKSANRRNALAAALEADDVEETKRLVRGALTKNEELVRSCFQEVAGAVSESPVDVAEQLAKDLFNETRSVANVRSFVERLQTALSAEVSEMPAQMPWGREDPVKMVDDFSSRPFPLLTRHFNAGECQKLMEVTRRGIPKANYPVLREMAEGAYARWSAELDKIRENARDLIHCLQKLERKFEKERERTVPGVENAFDHLFTDIDDPETGLDDRFSPRKFYRRELKPVLSQSEAFALVAEHVELTKELFLETQGSLLRARDFSEADAFDVRKRLEKDMERAIRDTAGLPDSFVVDFFSIRHVIGQLVKVWKNRLRKRMGWDRRNHLEERFEEFFGFIPERSDDGSQVDYDFPEIEDFILHMAAALARTCKPYWMLEKRRGQEFKVALFVPTELDQATAKNRVAKFLGDDTIRVEVYPEAQSTDPTGKTTANPFLLMAYSTEGVDQLDEIESLNYYVENEVYDLVKATEDPSGTTIFDGARNGGIGYIDPLYVRNEAVSAMRWKPWVDPSSLGDVEQQQTLDALLYALFPGDVEASERLHDIQSQLQSFGWKMPLFRNKGSNRFVFTRLPLTLVDGKPKTDHQTQNLAGWNEEKPISRHAGLHHLFEVLQGNEEPEKAPWRQRILEEADLFWSNVLTQINLAQGTPVFREMLGEYTTWLGNKSRAANEDSPSKPIWDQLLDRLNRMAEA